MGLNRALVQTSQGDRRGARMGDGFLAGLAPQTINADSNQVIGPSHIAGGLVLRAGMTAARNDTTATAAQLDATFADMNPGDSFLFAVSSQVAFTSTIAGGTGVTASGNLVVPANGFKLFLLVKTGTAAYNLIGL